MSGKPAARTGDLHVCPMLTGIVPHVGGPLLAMQAKVLVGGVFAARMGDIAICVGPPDSIAKGAFPVPIEMKPAARETDQTAHGGQIVLGCKTVEIGLAGTTGNPRVGTALCLAMAGGRAGGGLSQANGNCGIESSRQIIEGMNPASRTAASRSETGLLNDAINNGEARAFNWYGAPLPPNQVGGSTGADRVSLLARNGVGAKTIGSGSTGLANMQGNLSAGQGVIASLDAGKIWGPQGINGSGGHAVMVTGMDYDDAGNPIAVHYNDTGAGQCGHVAPYGDFKNAVESWGGENVATTGQIW